MEETINQPLMKQFFKVDSLGNVVDSILLDINDPKTVIPSDHYEGWGGTKQFWQPKWDSVLGNWVEGLPTTVIDTKKNEILLHEEMTTLEARLKETDWYAIRSVENGKSIPSDIRNERQVARDRISEIRLLLGI